MEGLGVRFTLLKLDAADVLEHEVVDCAASGN
jgi:hypothetical protein